MEILARFSHEKLDHTKDNSPHLVVSLTAPTLDWIEKRPAICLIPVVDLSGSMEGGKLEKAKDSLLKLVDQLQPGDITGLLGFSTTVTTLVKPGPVTPELKEAMRKSVKSLRASGGTDLCAGLLDGLNAVANLDLGPQYLRRIVIFTDGQPTNGVTDQKTIIRLLLANLGNITVSAFGYGAQSNNHMNGCDHDFLTQMAQEGKGNYAYVNGPDDSLTAFGRELGGLLSTYAQDIVVELEPFSGHQITKAVTNIPIEQNQLGETDFKISDILSEETRHFVFETKLNRQEKGGPRAVNIFTVKVSYSVLTEAGKRETRTVEAKVKAQFVGPGEEQQHPDKALDEIIALAQVVRAQLEAEEQAKKGHYDAAVSIMDGLVGSLGRRGHAATGKVAGSIRQRLSSKSAYAGGEGYLRTMAFAGTRSYGMSSMDDDAARDLISCNVALGNSSQQATTSTFTGGSVVVPAAVPQVAPQDPLADFWRKAAEQQLLASPEANESDKSE